METFEKSTAANLNESISSPAGSLAKTSLSPADALELTESEAGCGLSSRVLLGEFDPSTYLLRTSQVCLLKDQCEEYSGTFPRSGSMRSGKVFQLPPLVHLTSATGFGYLPTPDKSLGGMKGGIMIEADATTCFRKMATGSRPSGAKIGSSLRWHPEYINEALRTGGLVNPAWLEALMGFPENWLTLPTEPTGTPSFQRFRRGWE